MISKTMLVGMCFLVTVVMNREAAWELPKPHYERKEADPAWVQTAVQFHGHLGPTIIAGARLGMAGLRAVDAKGYFDVEVTCEGPFEKPPQSCFLDGVQIGTGATLGKRNLHYVEAKEIVLRVKNTTTGKAVEVRPSKKLLEKLGLLKTDSKIPAEKDAKGAEHRHAEMERIEAIAREIAEMENEEIGSVK